jgi:DNA modification methylase
MSKVIFKTKLGVSYHGDSLKVISSKIFQEKYKGKINLIITSPPFSLVKKKKYGNENGQEYIDWLKKFSRPLTNLLTDDGSIIIELGNSYEKGTPIFSTIPIESLLEFKKESDLYLCQEFICHNPTRLPSPIEWVNVRRIRVKDSYTRIWWLSKTPYPKSDNSNVLKHYSDSMKKKIKNDNFYPSTLPSGHKVTNNFRNINKGSISPNFLSFGEKEYLFEYPENTLKISNGGNNLPYQKFCDSNSFEPHPARIQPELIEYFVRFLTDENDIVYDPFGGSNTTGMVAEKLNRKWISSEKHLDYIKGSLIRFFDENKSTNIIKRLATKGISRVVK